MQSSNVFVQMCLLSKPSSALVTAECLLLVVHCALVLLQIPLRGEFLVASIAVECFAFVNGRNVQSHAACLGESLSALRAFELSLTAVHRRDVEAHVFCFTELLSADVAFESLAAVDAADVSFHVSNPCEHQRAYGTFPVRPSTGVYSTMHTEIG